MAATDVLVRFGADTTALKSGASDAAQQVQGFADKLKGAGDESDSSSSRIKNAFGAIGAVVLSANAALIGIGASAVNFGEKMIAASGNYDQSLQSIGGMNALAGRAGLSLEQLGDSFVKMQKKAADGDEATVKALKVMGLTAQDVAGQSAEALEVKLANAFSKAADSSNKAAAATALFGSEAATKLLPILNQGGEHMREFAAMADRAGTTIGSDLRSKIEGTSSIFKQLDDRWQELKLTAEGGMLQAFQKLKPAIDSVLQVVSDLVGNFTSLTEWFQELDGAGKKNIETTGLLSTAAQTFAQWMVQASAYVQEFAVKSVQYFLQSGISLDGLGAVAKAFGQDLANMANTASQALYDAMHNAIEGVILLFGDLAEAGKKALSFDFSGVSGAFAKFKTDAGEVGDKIKQAFNPDYLAGTNAALDKMRQGAQAHAAELDKVIAKLEQQKAAQLALIASGGKKAEAPGGNDIADPSVKKAKAGGDDATRAAMKEIEGEIEATRSGYKLKEEIYSQDEKLHLISEQQKVQGTKDAIDDEYGTERDLLQKELALNGLKLAQKQEINNKLVQLDAKYAQEQQKIWFEEQSKIVAQWDKMVDAMSSSLSSGIMGMINGTKNFQQVMAGMANAIIQQFVKMGVDIAANWLKTQIANVVVKQGAETTMTTATATGAAARTSIGAGAAAAGMATTIATAFKNIAVSAGETFAGVFGFLSPVMGPAAAGPAAAAQSSVLGVAKYDIGAWSLPQDQLAMVHKNELIMPAAEAGAFRSMLSNAASGGAQGAGGSGGDTHVHFNVQAVDSASVRSFFSSNSKHILNALNGAVRNGDHLGLRALGQT
jgi:hypothetical protein